MNVANTFLCTPHIVTLHLGFIRSYSHLADDIEIEEFRMKATARPLMIKGNHFMKWYMYGTELKSIAN